MVPASTCSFLDRVQAHRSTGQLHGEKFPILLPRRGPAAILNGRDGASVAIQPHRRDRRIPRSPRSCARWQNSHFRGRVPGSACSRRASRTHQWYAADAAFSRKSLNTIGPRGIRAPCGYNRMPISRAHRTASRRLITLSLVRNADRGQASRTLLRHVGETREVQLMRNGDRLRLTVTVLGDDEICFA